MENGYEEKRQRPEVHGVLRSPGSSDPSIGNKHIQWDEETIAEHDLMRGTRMKIDEPNTPYNHYDTEEDDEHVADGVGYEESEAREQKSPSAGRPSKDLSHKWDELHSKLEKESKKRTASWSGSESSDNDSKSKHKEFEKHRKAHYNEFKVLQEFRKSHSSLEDDDENEDKKADGQRED